jgi:dipeptidyl aminopeptidase/acylaminoacyl peptidase
MNRSSSRGQRGKVFLWIVLGCIVLAVGYTAWVLRRANASAALAQTKPLSAAGAEELQAIQRQAHLVFLAQAEAPYGQVSLVGLDPEASSAAQTALQCDRIHYASGNGLCLMYDTAVSLSDPLAPPQVRLSLLGADFQPRHQITAEGIPSRARVSPDGKYAAYTVFLTGHSYNDPNMSTATVLLNTATGASLGNLEEFETWKDGQVYDAPEFNFWGITFAKDSNLFYATLRHGGTTYLVRGDVSAGRLTVVHENVECPSLSPDGTRIAFKKQTGSRWQLTVLDLATMQETTLAEPEGIDDQVEWLDNDRILYQKADYDPPKWVSVFVIPADGSGQPEIFLPNATSPAVVYP